MSSQMLSGARSMSILSPTKEENLAECAPESVRRSEQVRTSSPPPRQTMVTQLTQSYQAVNQFSGTSGLVNTMTYDGPENSPSKAIIEDRPQPLQEHELKDCSPIVKPTNSFVQTRLMSLRQLEPSAQHQPLSATLAARGFSSSQEKSDSGILKRISVSELGLRAENATGFPLRPSQSTYGDQTHRIAVRDWATPKDPLASISVAEDLASLAVLAQVLQEESESADPNIESSENTTGQNNKPLEETARGKCSKAKYEALNQRTVQSPKTNTHSKNSSGRSLLPELAVKPRAIEGPNYTHLPRSTPSPKKKSPEGPSRTSRSPTNVQHSSLLVSPQTTANGFHIDKTEICVNDSPRVSVRALAAKFNTCDSRSLSSPSPTKSPSKVASVDVRAVSDFSPKDKIIAPYTTNPPSPVKSQKSGKSDVSFHSIRIPLPLDQKYAKPSPPRRLLRSDLNDSTPLRSVPKSVEKAANSTKPALTLEALELPACCSPPGSPQRLTLYDGTSHQYSRSTSSDPSQCPMSPHVHFEPRMTAAAGEKLAITSYFSESALVPMATGPLTSPPPTRSNSLFHTQIRNLQQQLNNKSEELRHLKQQVDTRGILDIGALSEELREAKKETQIWKSRAEVAEKQLEVMATLSTRSARHNAGNLPSMVANSTCPSRTTGYSEDGADALKRIRALNGMDGASSHSSLSEESNETVVREIREETIIRSDIVCG